MSVPRPTMSGFWYFYARRSKSAQRDFFFYAIRRLARDYPDADPRDVLVTHFSHWVYRYERHLEAMNDEFLKHRYKPESGQDDRTPDDLRTDELTIDDLLDLSEGD